eukprot:GHVU01229944.1.p1 GENE.GHVU01229944.1~~GHVU01229944.1.p1  ORF type:complete len:265 (+),score=33.39 GHVU01229944.1:227-1021(+)
MVNDSDSSNSASFSGNRGRGVSGRQGEFAESTPEAVVGFKEDDGEFFYHTKWKGSSKLTWEVSRRLAGHGDLVKAYFASQNSSVREVLEERANGDNGVPDPRKRAKSSVVWMGEDPPFKETKECSCLFADEGSGEAEISAKKLAKRKECASKHKHAACQLCGVVMKFLNTSGMRNHLRRHHPDRFRELFPATATEGGEVSYSDEEREQVMRDIGFWVVNEARPLLMVADKGFKNVVRGLSKGGFTAPSPFKVLGCIKGDVFHTR